MPWLWDKHAQVVLLDAEHGRNDTKTLSDALDRLKALLEGYSNYGGPLRITPDAAEHFTRLAKLLRE